MQDQAQVRAKTLRSQADNTMNALLSPWTPEGECTIMPIQGQHNTKCHREAGLLDARGG